MLGEITSIRITIHVQGINTEDHLILKAEYEQVQWTKTGTELLVVYTDGQAVTSKARRNGQYIKCDMISELNEVPVI